MPEPHDVRALTVRQPWASLIATGAKTIETRWWRTDWRGDLLIYAEKHRPPAFAIPTCVDSPEAHAPEPWNANLPGLDLDNWFEGWESDDGFWWYCDYRWSRFAFGAVVAVARLADCVPIVERGDDDAPPPRTHVEVNGPPDRRRLWLARYLGRSSLGALGCPPCFDMDNRSSEHPLGDFTPGRWAWLLTDVRPIDPVPARGRQGLWRPDDGLVAACMQGART